MKTVLGITLILLMGLRAPAWGADGSVTAAEAWARATGPQTRTGIAFVTLTSTIADRLVSAATPTAAKVEFHRHVAADGMMKMRQQQSVDLPAGTTVQFNPGGIHLMLVDLKAPLAVGQSFPLTLAFEKAAPITVTVLVQGAGAGAPAPSSHDSSMHDQHMNDPAHQAMHDEHMKDPDHRAMHEMMHGPGN